MFTPFCLHCCLVAHSPHQHDALQKRGMRQPPSFFPCLSHFRLPWCPISCLHHQQQQQELSRCPAQPNQASCRQVGGRRRHISQFRWIVDSPEGKRGEECIPNPQVWAWSWLPLLTSVINLKEKKALGQNRLDSRLLHLQDMPLASKRIWYARWALSQCTISGESEQGMSSENEILQDSNIFIL